MVLRKKLTVLLMTLMVVMVASPLFGAHEVLAEDFLGTAGNDYLIGTASNDTLYGYEGDDYLEGRGGDDRLDAGVGQNTIYGNRGIDRIYTRAGVNYVVAGAGNDLIYAREEAFSYDRIDCGAGFDRVETLHSEDVTLRNCERTLGPAKGEIPE